jgi:uncharacterized OsmC-like protein
MSLKTVIEDSQAAIEADPSNAAATFAASGRLVGPTEVSVTARGHQITVDEPAALAGADHGANPIEHVLIGLASCQAITYQFWAAKLGVELEDVAIHAEGDLDVRGFFGFDDSVRPGLGTVRIRVELTGPESSERYRELADAVDAHCPVHDVFSNPTPIERTIASPVAAA